MHEELENFERNQVWVLVPPLTECHPIGTKWVFKNKQSEDGVVVRNKARLVAQGLCQKDGIDYEETFCNVLRFPRWEIHRLHHNVIVPGGSSYHIIIIPLIP